MDDEDIRKDFLISVDKFIVALQSGEEALAVFNAFWQGLNERLHAAPRSQALYELANKTSLAIGTAAESFLAVENAIQTSTDKLCEEAHILSTEIEGSEEDGKSPTDEEIKQDWNLLRDWFLDNIASPFVNFKKPTTLINSHEMDLDECDHWIRIVRSRSKWQRVYARYARSDPGRMRSLCSQYFPPPIGAKLQFIPPTTKDPVHRAFLDMRSSVIKAWDDLWNERQFSPDWLAEATRRISLLPTEEEMKILGWDNEWTEFDWDAPESLQKNRTACPSFQREAQDDTVLKQEQISACLPDQERGANLPVKSQDCILSTVELDPGELPGRTCGYFGAVTSAEYEASTTEAAVRDPSISPPFPPLMVGFKRKFNEPLSDSAVNATPNPLSPLPLSSSSLLPPDYSFNNKNHPTKRRRLDTSPESSLPFDTSHNIASSSLTPCVASPSAVSPPASCCVSSESGSEGGSPSYLSSTPPAISHLADTPASFPIGPSPAPRDYAMNTVKKRGNSVADAPIPYPISYPTSLLTTSPIATSHGEVLCSGSDTPIRACTRTPVAVTPSRFINDQCNANANDHSSETDDSPNSAHCRGSENDSASSSCSGGINTDLLLQNLQRQGSAIVSMDAIQAQADISEEPLLEQKKEVCLAQDTTPLNHETPRKRKRRDLSVKEKHRDIAVSSLRPRGSTLPHMPEPTPYHAHRRYVGRMPDGKPKKTLMFSRVETGVISIPDDNTSSFRSQVPTFGKLSTRKFDERPSKRIRLVGFDQLFHDIT